MNLDLKTVHVCVFVCVRACMRACVCVSNSLLSGLERQSPTWTRGYSWKMGGSGWTSTASPLTSISICSGAAATPDTARPPYIPFSQTLRLCRICSQEEDFRRRTEELKLHLQRRGYKEEQVAMAIQQAVTRQGGLPTNTGKGGRQLQHPSCSDLPPLPAFAEEHHSATSSSTTTVGEYEEECPSSTHCSLTLPQEPI